MATIPQGTCNSLLRVASDPIREGYGNLNQPCFVIIVQVASDPIREGYGNHNTW